MSKKLIYLLLAVSLGLNIGVIATTLIHRGGKTPPPPAGPRAGDRRPLTVEGLVEGHLKGITEHLGLSEEQRQAIRELLERHAPQQVTLQRRVAETGRRLEETYAAREFDPELFRRFAAEASEARSRLDSLSAVVLLAETSVLSDEQRLRFAEVALRVHGGQTPPPGQKSRPGQGAPPRGGPPPGGPPPPR